MRQRRASLGILFLLATSLVGCESTNPKAGLSATENTLPKPICGFDRITPIGSLSAPAGYEIQGAEFGGISGIEYAPGTNTWLLVSDDKSEHGIARYFRAKILIKNGAPVDLHINDVIELRGPEGRPFASSAAIGQTADAESIRLSLDGETIYWASEGNGKKGQGPALFQQALIGTGSTEMPLPPELVRDFDHNKGPRDNRSFEGLSIDQDGSIWLGLEAPLIENGDVPTEQSGAVTQIYRIDKSGTILERVNYKLDKIARRIPGLLADNGLAEILILPKRRMLVLERSGSQNPDGLFEFSTRLYCADLTPVDNRGEYAEKSLLVTSYNTVPVAAANFEGIALGPALANDGRVLALVADNNFAAGVATYISFYAVFPDPTPLDK